MRFGGTNKALAEIGGKTILDRIFSAFGTLFTETMVVTNAPREYLPWDTLIATDIFKARSPLAGIHAALSYARTPHIFVTPCDTPFIATEMIETILGHVDGKSDIVVPETEKGLQPLCAVYAKTCLPVIEKQLRMETAATNGGKSNPQKRILNQGLKIINLYDQVRVKKIPEKDLRTMDPELKSFFNINTPEDFSLAEQMLLENQTEKENP
jgi:molybdopterin-guanine dinucleotide biosynthesis protein A